MIDLLTVSVCGSKEANFKELCTFKKNNYGEENLQEFIKSTKYVNSIYTEEDILNYMISDYLIYRYTLSNKEAKNENKDINYLIEQGLFNNLKTLLKNDSNAFNDLLKIFVVYIDIPNSIRLRHLNYEYRNAYLKVLRDFQNSINNASDTTTKPKQKALI
ncbi:MAG: hypothetical protein RR359_02375 [Bacilli bacterium]